MKTPTHSKDGVTPLPLSALRLLAPPLRLVCASMWKVVQQRDAVHYGKLEEIITSIFETVPGLLNYRHQARLRMGLRALMILEELRQSDPPDIQHVLQELGKLQAFSVYNGKKVEEAKCNFHSLVQCLLKRPATRKQFFKEDFHVQYGGHYVASLEKLLWEFLTRLDQLLPAPDLAQTVSWLSAAPAVLDECARSATQPQLLRTLLQHEKCLGHLGSTSLLSSTGDSILSSLSLPLSGKVLHTIQSESTPTSNRVISSALLTPRATCRTTHEALSQVAPVIGSISIEDLQKNVLTMKAASREVESASERSKNNRTKQRSCSEKEILEKDPKQDYFVGNMLVSVISQSSESEKEEERDNKENRNDRESSSEDENRLVRKNRNREKERYVQRDYSPKRNTQGMGSQEQTDVSALHISCMKRQPRVVIPRLNISSVSLPVHLNYLTDKQDDTRSLHQANIKDIFSVGISDSVKRKRKFIDLTPTPDKHMVDIINKQTLSASPCIPRVLHRIMATPETPSPVTDSTDDIIVDTEDETPDKVRRKNVSWLSAAPAVLDECARSATQPQLLRTLLQQEKCLGSASLLSSTGDSILSSLSLSLSGEVLHTIQSESTPTSNRVISSSLLTPRATRRTTHEALSQVAPVIGSISTEDLQKNVLTMKAASREVESASERSKNTRTKQRSCSEKEILEKDPKQDYFVGNMLVSVISQSSESGKEEERDNKKNRNDRESSSEGESRLVRKNRNREKERYVQREYSPKRNTQGMGSQEQTDVSALHISCMKRQPKVVIPRLNISSVSLPVHLNYLTDKQDDTRSLHQANVKDIFSVGTSDSVKRKRKFIDLTPTPEKHMVDIINKQTLSASPCIPRVLHRIMATPETPSPIIDSTDDIIVDSEDETTDKVRRKVFTQHYCKTKNGTYVPTLHEYWNSLLYCRDVASPGNRC
ncbi:uncharacterized protein LOC127450328 isoform X2 [Myxocyprinus asiaticus]|uniref:uncharacterized protein LOC127450328 isoform X2 n=1 Tax=Myxocyprinus asiaticus TaxID=70543 RepID=UPI0022227285|nr:uncharacterized protein LOC127450328 isoform X2 [Myxocyprinus asiaticus]